MSPIWLYRMLVPIDLWSDMLSRSLFCQMQWSIRVSPPQWLSVMYGFGKIDSPVNEMPPWLVRPLFGTSLIGGVVKAVRSPWRAYIIALRLMRGTGKEQGARITWEDVTCFKMPGPDWVKARRMGCAGLTVKSVIYKYWNIHDTLQDTRTKCIQFLVK